MDFLPAYTYLTEAEWQAKITAAEKILLSCTMCPRNCKVDRVANQKGYCQSGFLPEIALITIHHGEEPVISGKNGTGNIFLAHCNLQCIFCQNHQISNSANNRFTLYTAEQLAEEMVQLQNKGVHNIGLVSPSHFALQLIPVIKLATQKGLKIPLVYNSNGYDSVEALALLEGIIDIYLPDCKYGSDSCGSISNVKDYFTQSQAAIREMYRQVGKRLLVENDTALRGLIIRHLVLPDNLAETRLVMEFIAKELSPGLHISLMSQYYPTHQAAKFSQLNRKITPDEYQSAMQICSDLGLDNGWFQMSESSDCYRPDFNNPELPFI